MPNTVIAIRKSATPASVPSSLEFGELALNYNDGKLFYKNTSGQIAEFSSSGGSNFGTVNASGTLIVSDTTGDILTLLAGNNLSITGDAVNDRITIGLTNDVTLPGVLYMQAIGGDEGGQIELANAITNSTLSGNVVIDIYQNRLRFYEKGTPNKGAFLDLSLAGSGVSTNLLSSGGSTSDTVARTTANAAFDQANTAYTVANAAFGQANSVGAGANSFASATIAGANTAVGGGANNFARATIAGANTAVGGGANAFTSATIAGANTAVGGGANAFTSATIAGANTAVGAGANNFARATIAGANTAVGAGANAFTSATIAGANTAVGAGANAFTTSTVASTNTFLLSVIAGANTAVGGGANAFTSATIAGANTAVGNGANTFLLAVIAGANTAVGAGANSFASATIAGANTISIAAFGQANTGYTVANAAFERANTGGGLTIGNQTTSASTFYPILTTNTTGSISFSNTSSTKLTFVPSTGTLSATVFNSLSDIKYKTNINTIDNALNKVSSLRGVEFTWKDNEKRSIGLIAQEVFEVIPEVVNIDENDVRTLNYDSLVGVLIEAIKELKQRLETIEDRNNV